MIEAGTEIDQMIGNRFPLLRGFQKTLQQVCQFSLCVPYVTHIGAEAGKLRVEVFGKAHFLQLYYYAVRDTGCLARALHIRLKFLVFVFLMFQ
jgi:hypothetical protein